MIKNAWTHTKNLWFTLAFIGMLFFINKWVSSSYNALENYLQGSEELVSKIGHIESIKVGKSTWVHEGRSYDGKVSLAYNTFQCVVYGASGKAKVVVKETNIEKNSGHGSFSIEEIAIVNLSLTPKLQLGSEADKVKTP